MNIVRAEIITIGDEILYGQILDTNSQWMSQQLNELGVRIVRKTSVGDNREDILASFAAAEEKVDLVLITGGLGPTKDDLTKPLLAEFFDTPLVRNEQAFTELEALFKSRGRVLNELNHEQAVLPEASQMISNPMGSAAGMWLERNGKVFVSMPGVPVEMKTMMKDSILPKIGEYFDTPVIYHKMVRTIGIGESWLADKIDQWHDQLPPAIGLAYLPSLGQVKLRLTATGTNRTQLEEMVEAEIGKLQQLVPEYIYGYNQDLIEEVIGKMLTERDMTVATAESCSGGYIAHQITSVSGSSKYFMGSVVAYDNQVKIDQLGVQADTLEQHGAVSQQTAEEMALGVRERLGTTIGISSTGVAGPTGGTPDKPVGTVWIAYADAEKTISKKLQLGNDRDRNIKMTAISALNLLRQSLPENGE